MIGPKWLGVVAVGLHWGVLGPKPNQMVLDEKWCWNPTWHALDIVTLDFVLFFQAHFLEVSLVKIVTTQWCKKISIAHL
jgi:hypothetical protein